MNPRSQPNSFELGQASLPSLPVTGNSDPYFSQDHNTPSGPASPGSASFKPLPGNQPVLPISDANPKLVNPVNNPISNPDTTMNNSHMTVDHFLPPVDEFVVDICQFQDDQEAVESLESQMPMPIRGAFITQLSEEYPDHAVAIPNSPTPAHRAPVSQDAEGKFVARAGAVVEIDGNEGFDYIDLSDRDIASVSFHESSITVNDADHQEAFTIQYRNVQHALFANGQMIELQHG